MIETYHAPTITTTSPTTATRPRGRGVFHAPHLPAGSRFGLLLAGAFVGLALWLIPQWQLAASRTRVDGTADLQAVQRLGLERDLFDSENAARGTLTLILSATVLFAGAHQVWRKLGNRRDDRTHERFAVAIEQLGSERVDGSPRTETRLAGVYALGRLATESEAEYVSVVEVLSSYVRENAPRDGDAGRVPSSSTTPRPRADIQTILAVLGRLVPPVTIGEHKVLDLRETNLRGASLVGAQLGSADLRRADLCQVDGAGAALTGANLREADLRGALLAGANLEGAHLSRANLEGAHLNGANLRGVNLAGANLRGADLWEADLRGCNLRDADLRDADLSDAHLEEAILWRADLDGASLKGAIFRDTHLERANLRRAIGLTLDQGEGAFSDDGTILPDYLLGSGRAGALGDGYSYAPEPAAPPVRVAAASVPAPMAADSYQADSQVVARRRRPAARKTAVAV